MNRSHSSSSPYELSRKKRKSMNFLDSYPDISPYTKFSPLDIDCPSDDFEIECPHFVPKRIANPAISKDQSLQLRSKKIRKLRNKEKKYPLYKFSSKFTPKVKIIPEISTLKPIFTTPLIVTDGIRQILQYKRPKLVKLLTPTNNEVRSKSSHDDDVQIINIDNEEEDTSNCMLSSEQKKKQSDTFLTIKLKSKKVDYAKPIRGLFKSIMAPSKVSEDIELDLNKPSLYFSNGAKPPMPNLPSCTTISLVDYDIANYEKIALTTSNFYYQDLTARFCEPGPKSHLKYITKIPQLSLSSGEFVFVECLDHSPVIRPLIGMSAQLNVLINIQGENTDQNPFDSRIPVTQITSASIQPFIAPIPPNTYILEITSSVSTAALAQHTPPPTDFILTYGDEPQLHSMPNQIYLSTIPESNVLISKPSDKFKHETFNDFIITSYLSQFEENPPKSAEELCKTRSILESIFQLLDKNIRKVAYPALKFGLIEKFSHLPPEMRALVRQYLKVLKSTNWNRANAFVKARLGIVTGYSDVLNDYTCEKNHKSKLQLRKELSQSFENSLLYIQKLPENDDDNSDFIEKLNNLFGTDNSDEDGWDDLFNQIQIDDIPKIEKSPSITRTKIDWESLGLGNIPKRKVMKVIKYSYDKGRAVASVHWVRDSYEITAAETKLKRTNSGSRLSVFKK